MEAPVHLSERVLVIEDDASLGDMFGKLLPYHDIEVTVVEDAEAGLRELVSQPYDVILVDKNLPGMSGLQVLQRVKDTMPDIEVIMMTAYADIKSLLKAVEAGAFDYLTKPFDSLDEVVGKIRRALDKRRVVLENRRLIDHLVAANKLIEEMNHSLEGQVRERTVQLEKANERLQALSLTDDVTGLFNQRYLNQRLEEEFEREQRYHEGLAIAMLDIDHFKNVNDNHDHIFGSRVLAQVGKIISTCVRAPDVIVRYGGDEFVVLLPHTRTADAMVVAERIRERIEAFDMGVCDDAGGGSYFITTSIGVAAWSHCKAETAKELLRVADRALYAAKSGGRNRVISIIEDDETLAQAK